MRRNASLRLEVLEDRTAPAALTFHGTPDGGHHSPANNPNQAPPPGPHQGPHGHHHQAAALPGNPDINYTAVLPSGADTTTPTEALDSLPAIDPTTITITPENPADSAFLGGYVPPPVGYPVSE